MVGDKLNIEWMKVEVACLYYLQLPTEKRSGGRHILCIWICCVCLLSQPWQLALYNHQSRVVHVLVNVLSRKFRCVAVYSKIQVLIQ